VRGEVKVLAATLRSISLLDGFQQLSFRCTYLAAGQLPRKTKMKLDKSQINVSFQKSRARKNQVLFVRSRSQVNRHSLFNFKSSIRFNRC